MPRTTESCAQNCAPLPEFHPQVGETVRHLHLDGWLILADPPKAAAMATGAFPSVAESFSHLSPRPISPTPMETQRQDLYFALIEQLLNCPNGSEPEVLDAHAELLDPGLVQAMMQVATYMAHHDNQDGAKFLVHVARELAKQLGLYPEPESELESTESTP